MKITVRSRKIDSILEGERETKRERDGYRKGEKGRKRPKKSKHSKVSKE